MQTFMPFQDFDMSAKDSESKELMAINGESKGWIHHPVTKMWIGYEQHLISYAIAICKEWISRFIVALVRTTIRGETL